MSKLKSALINIVFHPWCSNPTWCFLLFTKHHNFRSNRKGLTLQYLSCPGNMLMTRVVWFWSHNRSYSAAVVSIKTGFWSLQQNSVLLAIVGETVSLTVKNKCNSFYKIFFFFFFGAYGSTGYVPKLKLLLRKLTIYVYILCLDSEPHKMCPVFDIYFIFICIQWRDVKRYLIHSSVVSDVYYTKRIHCISRVFVLLVHMVGLYFLPLHGVLCINLNFYRKNVSRHFSLAAAQSTHSFERVQFLSGPTNLS